MQKSKRHSFFHVSVRILICVCVVAVVGQIPLVAQEDKGQKAPDASTLLPQNTVLFFQTSDIEELVEKFGETAVAKMFNDEELQPMLEDVYEAVDEVYEKNLREKTGVGLADLPEFLQGEVSFALVAPPREDLSIVLFIDIGEENEIAQTLLEKGRELALEDDRTEETEEIGETKLMILQGKNPIYSFQRQGKLCVCNNEIMIRSIIDRWDGNVDKRDRSLAQNRKFMNVMSRCNGTKEEPPQIRFFIDPIELYRDATRGNAMATVGLGFIRAIGLDGLSAIGASMIFAPEEFDSIFHVDVLLASPRSGVIEMVSLRPGDLTPEPWVPYNASNYMTGNLNFEKTFAELEKLYDQFRTEGKFAEDVEENINKNIGVDLMVDVVPKLNGRVSFVTWVAESDTFNGNANMLAFGIDDPEESQETLEKFVKKMDELISGTRRRVDDSHDDAEANEDGPSGRGLEEASHRGVKYYKPPMPDFEKQRQRQRERQIQRAEEEGREPPRERVQVKWRMPSPCFGIVGDSFLVTDSEELLKEAIETAEDEDKSLANDPEFENIMKQIRKQLAGREPGMITFARPEESFRMLYELAKSDNTREVLKDRGEDAEVLKSLHAAMENNELPEFEHFLKYMAPTGGVLINDESGIHYMAFSMRPKDLD